VFAVAAALFAGGSVAAEAAPAPVHGSFVSVFQKAGQRHRVYFVVEAGHGSKSCSVTLHARTVSVDLGTDHRSDLTSMLFLRVSGATKAYNQAISAPSPTRRIVCSH
jgi:hypothetical protein